MSGEEALTNFIKLAIPTFMVLNQFDKSKKLNALLQGLWKYICLICACN